MEAQGSTPTQSDDNKKSIYLIEKYKGMLHSDPNNLTILSNLGACYASINQFDEAMKLFNKILERDPKNLDGLNNLGVIYTQIGRFEEAIAKLEIVVKLKPESTKFWSNLGEAYRRSGNYHKANVCRMRALQLSENLKV